jgi:hypothetical protein
MLTIQEAIKSFTVAEETVSELVNSGKINSYKIVHNELILKRSESSFGLSF